MRRASLRFRVENEAYKCGFGNFLKKISVHSDNLILLSVREKLLELHANGTLAKCLVLCRQDDGCRIEVQVQSLFIPYSCHVFMSFVLFVGVS